MANTPPGGDVQMTPEIFLGGVAVGERGMKKELNSSDASEDHNQFYGAKDLKKLKMKKKKEKVRGAKRKTFFLQ